MQLRLIHESVNTLRPVDLKSIGTDFTWYKWTVTINRWGKTPASEIRENPRMAFHLLGKTKTGQYCVPGFVAPSIYSMGIHFGLGGTDIEGNRRPVLMVGSATYSNAKTREDYTVTDYHEKIHVKRGSPAYQGSLNDDEVVILDRVPVKGIFFADFYEEEYVINIYNNGSLIHQVEFEDGRQF